MRDSLEGWTEFGDSECFIDAILWRVVGSSRRNPSVDTASCLCILRAVARNPRPHLAALAHAPGGVTTSRNRRACWVVDLVIARHLVRLLAALTAARTIALPPSINTGDRYSFIRQLPAGTCRSPRGERAARVPPAGENSGHRDTWFAGAAIASVRILFERADVLTASTAGRS
jgi:hypothetical protein